MILAAVAEKDAIAAFLKNHAATSMFPLSNLLRHGMEGGHPRACSCWVRRKAGQITDVLTISDDGIVLPQCPSGDWNAVAAVLRERKVKGFIGAADQVAALRQAGGLTKTAQLDAIEPCYALQIDKLVMPEIGALRIVPLATISRDVLIVWRAAYAVESLAIPAEDAVLQAEVDIAAYIQADSHRILMDGDVPVAMTGFNATLPEIVQIGGVYTPPELRNRGYARKALALHLAQASINGVKDAVLFAANPAAEKAYVALGFIRSGAFALALYEDHQHG